MRSLLLLAALAASVCIVESTVAAEGADASAARSCRTHPDTSRIAVESVRQALTMGDSADLVSIGFPYNPTDVHIVTNGAVCDSVIRAFNALFTPEERWKHIRSAFIVQAEKAYALRVPSAPGYQQAYFFFDSAFAYQFNLTELD